MKTSKKAIALLMAAVLLAGAFAGCSSGDGTTAPADTTASGETTTGATTTGATTTGADTTQGAGDNFNETSHLNLMWYGNANPGMFQNPWYTYGGLHMAMMYESLVRVSGDGTSYKPYLASDYSVSDDGLTYTFNIRDTSVWSDGTPLTMDDVLFTFARRVRYPVSVPAALTYIEGVQDVIDGNAETISGVVADGWKLTITLTEPRMDFMSVLPPMAILPKHLLEDVDILELDTNAFWENPVGSGPYVIDEIQWDNYFTMVAREDYVGAYTTPVKKVVFTDYSTGGAEAVAAAFIAGNLDFAMGSIVNDIDMANNIVANNPDISYKILPSSYTRSFAFNMTGSTDGSDYNDDVQKKEVRWALNMLLDKESIASMYQGQATALTTYFSPDSPDYNTDIPLFQRDVEGAKALLDEAGFDYSRPIRIGYTYTDQTTKDIMDLITVNFAEAGVKAEPFLITGDTVSVLYETRPYEMAYQALSSSVPDLMIGAYSGTAATYNANSTKIYGNEEERARVFNGIYNDYIRATDAATQSKLRKEMQAAANEMMLVSPVYVLNRCVIINTSKWQFDESMFGIDVLYDQDWMYDSWNLLK